MRPYKDAFSVPLRLDEFATQEEAAAYVAGKDDAFIFVLNQLMEYVENGGMTCIQDAIYFCFVQGGRDRWLRFDPYILRFRYNDSANSGIAEK